jgi:hypothetical protein
MVRPIVALKFGQPVVITGEFVDKPNDYYSQNMVPEPYSLRVLSTDGKTLAVPVVIEYKLEAAKGLRSKIEHPGAVQTFEAYESLYQPLTSKPWGEEWEQGSGFALHHVLHIRPKRGGANKSPEPTPGSVTPAAGAASAPPPSAAQL